MRLEEIRPEVWEMGRKAQERCSARFQEIDSVAEINTMRVMSAFQKNRVSEACFSGTNGYGYDDLGRETLDRIFADVFHTESALVRIGFVNGTHALASALSRMMCDDNLRHYMSSNGIRNVQRFKIETIANQWKALFESNQNFGAA